ncbi:ATP-binding response regulator [Parabacteroides timonensis]|uniref:ATP-binding response regulator n=1 Tax=Parabacteroides timonensis TaxID=1871013 RepID=UPI00094E3488|nr:ATP-binding protein [Parabacteroides timonensis]
MNNPLLTIRIKIIAGYVSLVLLFLVVLYLAYREKDSMAVMDAQVERLLAQHRQTEAIAVEILDLSLLGEQLITWEDEEITRYRAQKDTVAVHLEQLKSQSQSNEQQERIDAVLSLLDVKEMHMLSMLESWHTLKRVSNTLIRERLPGLIRQTRRQQEQLQTAYEEELKKSGGLRGLFRNRKKAGNRSKERSEEILQQNEMQTTASLRSLASEIDRRQSAQTERLFALVDSLGDKNRYLNREISRLISEFSRTDLKLKEEATTACLLGRERIIRTISVLSMAAFAFAFLFYYLLHRDLRERLQNRRRLERTIRENEELLSARKNMMLTISHDLRAPLAAISGYAELLPDERHKENRRRYSDAILQSSERMLGLLNTLLGFYRLETGKEQPENKPFRLQPLADILTGEYAPLAAKKQLAFSTDYDGGDIVVTGDRERTLEIIANLLSNAVKFTAQGSVRLNMHYASDELTVTVEDTGAGMTEAETEAIFQPFERLDKSEVQGFGLGLSITLALVSLLNGTLEVASSPGKGSRFTVRLPLPLCKDTGDASQTPSALPCVRHLQVAVVDNDAVLLAMTVRMFDRNEIYADGFRSARELLEGMRTRRYDLILTDIVMPGMSGFGLLELLRSSNLPAAKAVPVVAMTARAERSEEEFIRAGFAGCLFKPFSRAELATVVSRCTAGQATEQTAVADFSMLLTNEQDKREMFALLVRETRKNMEALAAASEHCDTEALAALLHHLSPLWEALRIDSALLELRSALSSDNPSCDTLRSIADRIADTGKRLVEQIEAELKEGGYA